MCLAKVSSSARPSVFKERPMVCETATTTLDTLVMASKLMLDVKLPAEVFWAGGRLEVWKIKAGPKGKMAEVPGRS